VREGKVISLDVFRKLLNGSGSLDDSAQRSMTKVCESCVSASWCRLWVVVVKVASTCR
jgi:hypothetical protein